VRLGRLSQSMRGCDVAALGARVLEDFSKLRNASAEGLAKVDITSIPGSRDAPRYETNYRYFDFKRL